MDPIDSIRERNIFSILIIVSFLGGAFFLLFVQYISTNFIDELIKENGKLVTENRILVKKNQSLQANHIIKPEVTKQTIADKSDRIIYNASMARRGLPYLVAFILCVGTILCWFIIWQLRQLNRLVIKLDLAEKNAQESVIIKDNFLANMSHEIRTPLNSILGFTNIIRRRNTSADISEFADAINTSGENLLRIVNDILDLSKMEAGMMHIIKNPFHVKNLMQTAVALFWQNEKKLSLQVIFDDQVPEFVIGDANRLTQILVNLIGNAVKFSTKGEIKISVSVATIETNEVWLAFKIADQGIGIDPEKLELIFERFRQAEESITRHYGGSGLGLSIVKNLIQLQSGKISATSKLGIGTEISFEIPFEIVSADFRLSNLQVGNDEINRNNPMHLLVVEDNLMNQTLMKHLLTEWNFSFTMASDGNESIRLLKLRSFDAILMDLQMPGMDGYAATKYIREKLELQIPIIAMTAHALQGEKEKCIDSGMDAYLSKPINHNELLEILMQFTPAVISDPIKIPALMTIPEYQYIDLSYIKEVSNSSIAYEKIVTSQFIASIPDFLNSIQNGFENQNFAEINQIAHNMQTSLSIMGLLPKCSDLLFILENAEAMNHQVLNAIQELKNICSHAVLEAQHFYDSLS